jgi:hypothetical protein
MAFLANFRPKRLASNKHSGLMQSFVNYGYNFFIILGPGRISGRRKGLTLNLNIHHRPHQQRQQQQTRQQQQQQQLPLTTPNLVPMLLNFFTLSK